MLWLDNCYRFEVSAHICFESMWTSASFHKRCFGQGFAYTEVAIFPLTEGLISWASDYMVLVVMGMMKVNDLWQYKKGSKQYTPFINLCECIMCAFKIHCTKHRCELPPDTFWVEFLSRSHWRDLTRLQQLFTTLTMGERDTESRVHFLEWKKEWKGVKKI